MNGISAINANSFNTFDAATMASALVNAERTPSLLRIQQRQAQNTLQISSLGTFKNALSNIQSSIPTWKDTDSLEDKKTSIEKMVSSYNANQTTVNNLTQYSSSTKTAGPLASEPSVRRGLMELRGAMDLSSFGISFQRNGTLKIDSNKLNESLTDTEKSAQLKTVLKEIDSSISNTLSTKGAYAQRVSNLQNSQDKLELEKTKMNERFSQQEEKYYQQFSRLNSLMASFQSTSAYLTAQFSSLKG